MHGFHLNIEMAGSEQPGLLGPCSQETSGSRGAKRKLTPRPSSDVIALDLGVNGMKGSLFFPLIKLWLDILSCIPGSTLFINYPCFNIMFRFLKMKTPSYM